MLRTQSNIIIIVMKQRRESPSLAGTIRTRQRKKYANNCEKFSTAKIDVVTAEKLALQLSHQEDDDNYEDY